jgi:exopolysaccharide biosynthesis WecB/TagA/CpsF family protein
MEPSDSRPVPAAPRLRRPFNRDTVALVGDLLPLCDFICVLLAVHFATLLYVLSLSPETAAVFPLDAVQRAALAAAVIAPLVLCDRVFVGFASGGQTAALVRCYVVRFALFVGVVLVLGSAARFLPPLPPLLLVFWLVASLAVTALVRIALVATLRRLEGRGRLSERVAIVGDGAVADRLLAALALQRPGRVAVTGHYSASSTPGTTPLAELLERGKSEPFDWILLAPPDGADPAAQVTLTHRLKALSVPVARYRPDHGPAPLAPTGLRSSLPVLVPLWILTLLGMLTGALSRFAAILRRPRAAAVSLILDHGDLDVAGAAAQRFGTDSFGYVVTPNVDHLIRLHEDPNFRRLYEQASYVLLDSRFLALCLRVTRGLRLPVCTGSDLTSYLLGGATRHDDELVLIGGTPAQAERLRQLRGLCALHHHNPPMGFINDPVALETCLQFIEAHSPFRYCLLAVGAPQQEQVAGMLKARGRARGLALCVGASINFITGEERRAPAWMQRAGLEWLFRLKQSPRRLARRYLVRGPQVFALLWSTRVISRPFRQLSTPLAWERRTAPAPPLVEAL